MPVDLTKRVLSSQINPEEMHEKEVVVAGWVEDVRVVGKILFAILRDREGRVQITVKKNENPEIYELLKGLHRESVIGVLGKVVKSDIARMGFEIIPRECEVYSRAYAPLPIGIIDKV
ncbi:MAG: aspartate--tRNA(Asn) ligase, partial [Thermoplasmata archaeon]